MNRRWSTAISAALGLIVSSSLLVTPGPAAVAAPAATLAVPMAPRGSTLPRGSLVVNPVAEDGSVIATYIKSERVKKRPVILQISFDNAATWRAVKKVKMTSAGVAVFIVDVNETAVYRAVAQRYKKKRWTAVTETSSSGWTLQKNYEFNTGDPSNADWSIRAKNSFATLGRTCSAPQPENVTTAGNFATLSMAVETDAARIAAARIAGCAAAQTYSNGMVGTQGTFTMQTGILAARVKFPMNRGMHGGVWLQSAGGPEIDMVESYGYGKGITNVYHFNGEHKVYKENTKAEWWASYHVFSVEWTTDRMIFRVDGDITSSVPVTTPPTSYFPVMSLLSSDWELDKLVDSSLPATMSVDWVRAWQPKS